MERIELIDYLKGYAIILVVLGHVIVFSNPTEFTQSQLFTFVYSFHMPLLLFLSGYLVCQKPIGSKSSLSLRSSQYSRDHDAACQVNQSHE